MQIESATASHLLGYQTDGVPRWFCLRVRQGAGGLGPWKLEKMAPIEAIHRPEKGISKILEVPDIPRQLYKTIFLFIYLLNLPALR